MDLKKFYSETGNKVLVLVPRDRIQNSTKRHKEILNVFCGPIKSKYLFIRGIFEYLMQFIMYLKAKDKIKKFNPDTLICYSPSIFFHYLIKKIMLNKKIKSYLILRDIFPYWAIECRYLNNYLLKKFYIYSFNSFLKIFNKIGVESLSNINYLKKKTNLKNIYHLPNWIKLKGIKFNNKKIKNSFIFSGNLGGGQDIDKVYNFFKKIKNLNQVNNLSILGDGMNSARIKSFKDLNINYYKKIPFSKYVKFLNLYEYGIISLKDEIKSVNFPGRLLTYLNSGLPIIVLSNKDNELSKFVTNKKIGVVIKSKENIINKLNELRKIKKNFIKSQTNIEVLKKYFNLENNTKNFFN